MKVYSIWEKWTLIQILTKLLHAWQRKNSTVLDAHLEAEDLCLQKSLDCGISRLRCFMINPFKEKMETKLKNILGLQLNDFTPCKKLQ